MILNTFIYKCTRVYKLMRITSYYFVMFSTVSVRCIIIIHLVLNRVIFFFFCIETVEFFRNIKFSRFHAVSVFCGELIIYYRRTKKVDVNFNYLFTSNVSRTLHVHIVTFVTRSWLLLHYSITDHISDLLTAQLAPVICIIQRRNVLAKYYTERDYRLLHV